MEKINELFKQNLENIDFKNYITKSNNIKLEEPTVLFGKDILLNEVKESKKTVLLNTDIFLNYLESSQEYSSNVFDLNESVGINGKNLVSDVKKVQQRLKDLGFDIEVNGIFDKKTETSIKMFQNNFEKDIKQIIEDCSINYKNDSIKTKKGKSYKLGLIEPDDSTNQVLAQCFPKRINGKIMTEEQAYDYFKSKIIQKGFSFNENKFNILGIRGFQGGEKNDNLENFNKYNDSFICLYKDKYGNKKVKEFKGSVDPGKTNKTTYIMPSNTQLEYTFNKKEEEKPSLWMTEPVNAFIDINKNGVVDENDKKIKDKRGLAIHSGGSGKYVKSHSRGCQVIHGDYYYHFFKTIVQNSNENKITYTLLDNSL